MHSPCVPCSPKKKEETLMGGSIALSIRFTDDDMYRGSCHTNVLPEGLWAPEFYIDLDTSRAHSKKWLDQILAARRDDPEIEAMWGGWNKLAPLSYGIVIVDYVTSTLVSAQGYSSPDWIIKDHKPEKWAALEKAGLLGETWDTRYPRENRRITLPFKDVRISDVDGVTEDMLMWAHNTFVITAHERIEWLVFIEERDDD